MVGLVVSVGGYRLIYLALCFYLRMYLLVFWFFFVPLWFVLTVHEEFLDCLTLKIKSF